MADEPAATVGRTSMRRQRAQHRERLAAVHRLHPRFGTAVLADARVALARRGEPPMVETRWGQAAAVAHLMWASDAFFGHMAYRAKARLQALGVPILPMIAHKLAMGTAQICIGDPVVMEPGVYIAHGQVVADGFVRIGEGTVLFPWVTLGLRRGVRGGPRLGPNVQVGSGAKIVGPVVVGRGARIGANAVVVDDVAPGTTVVGVPARPVGAPDQAPA